MNESSKKNNILDKRKVISIVITLMVMIPFVVFQYLNFLDSNLKYFLDNLPIYKWLSTRSFALTSDGNVMMHSSPRYGFLGDLQELITALIFIGLTILLYLIINKSLLYLNKKEIK